MQWELNNNSPIYLQIAENIKLEIISGAYMPGDKIDSVRDFAEKINVNPNTMQRALSKLEDEGLLLTNRTSGKYVTEDVKMIEEFKFELAQKYVKNFLASMKQSGFTGEEILRFLKSEIEKGDDIDVHTGVQ
jgi:DNA-binding transcriptional regulator YhcF (GntR family)